MNIDWVIPCRYAEVHDNLGTIIGAGIDTIWAAQMPVDVQVLLAVRLLGVADELGEDHKHQARNLIRDPSGETIGEEGAEFAIGSESAREDWLNGFILPAMVQFRATSEGTYTIEHQVDQDTKSVPIHVVQGAPPGAAPPA